MMLDENALIKCGSNDRRELVVVCSFREWKLGIISGYDSFFYFHRSKL